MTTTVRPTQPDRPGPPSPHRPGIRAILTPGWIGIILLGLAFAAACWSILAPWQFSRHTEREAQNAQIVDAMAASAVPVTDLLALAAAPPPSAEWRTVTATGTFVPDAQVYVRLRQYNGNNAKEVVLPFVLTDGTRILVDRGYVVDADLSDGLLPDTVPTGEVTITGRVSADQPDPSNRPDQVTDGRREVYGIDSARLLGGNPGTASPARLGFVQLSAGSPGALAPIGVPDRDSGPFLSYALQWCVFGGVALMAVGFFAFREVTDPVPDENGTAPLPATADSAPNPSAETPTGRRPKFDKSQLYD